MENKRNYKYDLIEDSDEYKTIETELHEKIVNKMGGSINRGNSHLYSIIKKEILKKEYNIEWKSPQELNPNIKFN